MTGEHRPRVVFVCSNLEAGGAERQWATLVPGLHEQGFDVRVITLDGRGTFFDELSANGVRIACAGLRHRADPIGLARVVRLAGPRSSVVVSRDVSAHLVAAVLARRQGAAHVVTEHLGPDPLGVRPYRLHQRMLLRPVRPRVAAVVAVAASQREHLVAGGYRPGVIRVIANGVRDDPPVRDRAAMRAELDVPPDAFLAVLVAALRPEKRATVFVEQVAAAHAVEPAVHGLVVGRGRDADAVARAAEASGGAVRMVGYRADALDVMHAADVVCLTSSVEALPMSLLEAMSVARPVIATDVGGVRDVVADGETGIVIPLDDPAQMAGALVALMRAPAQAQAMGEAGRARQRRMYSTAAMIQAYADLLAGLAGRNRASSPGWAGS